MHALPAAAPPAPRRQVLVGMSLAVVAIFMVTGSMLAVWLLQRDAAKAAGSWIPDGVTVPEVATNVMLISFAFLLVFVHWAIYSARRQDRGHTAFALGCTALVALLIINAQAFTYHEMELSLAEGGTYATMFYALTGLFMVLMIIGLLATVVVAFRYIGGRTSEPEVVVGHALYWWAVAIVYTAIWFYVYVSK